MNSVNVMGFDPALADPTGFSLILIPIVFHLLAVLVPGIVAYITWQYSREPRIINEIRTSATDLTAGERAFIEKEKRDDREEPRAA